ncbi:hypothetical protein ACU4GD_27425, partial [Cupriavidus basilensis]
MQGDARDGKQACPVDAFPLSSSPRRHPRGGEDAMVTGGIRRAGRGRTSDQVSGVATVGIPPWPSTPICRATACRQRQCACFAADQLEEQAACSTAQARRGKASDPKWCHCCALILQQLSNACGVRQYVGADGSARPCLTADIASPEGTSHG